METGLPDSQPVEVIQERCAGNGLKAMPGERFASMQAENIICSARRLPVFRISAARAQATAIMATDSKNKTLKKPLASIEFPDSLLTSPCGDRRAKRTHFGGQIGV